MTLLLFMFIIVLNFQLSKQSTPTFNPTRLPSFSPTIQPSVQRTSSPTNPTVPPTGQPSSSPTSRPSFSPTVSYNPTSFPTGQPSGQPTRQPTSQPTSRPSRQPTAQPTRQPTSQPTGQPTRQPTAQPTKQPISKPTGQPTRQPTSQPTSQPTRQPTSRPSRQPTSQPTRQPTRQPTSQPTTKPTNQPTGQPTRRPTCQPTSHPTRQPTSQPTRKPTMQPTSQPSSKPTSQPTVQPTTQPTSIPSSQPTSQPSRQPTTQPTSKPSVHPTSSIPTSVPTSYPSAYPSTSYPTNPGVSRPPSRYPTSTPTLEYGNSNDTSIYQIYKKLQNEIISDKSENSVKFFTYQYKGINDAESTNWDIFSNSTSQIPFNDIYFQSINLTFGNENLKSNQYSVYNGYCDNPIVINNLILSLGNGTKYSGSCNNNEWVTYYCPYIGPVLCLNCKVSCSQTSCPTRAKTSINPYREDCIYEYANFAVLQLISNQSYNYYPKISNISIENVYQNYVSVKLNISSIGRYYCYALNEKFELFSTDVILQYGSAYIQSNKLDESINIYLNLYDLYSEISYSIYCLSQDLVGNTMPLSVVKSNQINNVAVKCCQHIQWDINNPTVISNTSYQNFITYLTSSNNYLSNQLNYYLTINTTSFPNTKTCKSLNKNINKSKLPILEPNLLTFQSNITFTQYRYFKILNKRIGCYVINIYNSNNVLLLPNYISIVDSNLLITRPKLTLAVFSMDGLYVLIHFNMKTDRGKISIPNYQTIFICDYLFQFIYSQYAHCQWVSDSIVQISYRNNVINNYKLNVNDVIKLLPNVIKQKCDNILDDCKYSPANSSIVSVSYPQIPLKPQVTIILTKYISRCDDMILDISSSYGNGGRSWRKMFWNVHSIENEYNYIISNYLNQKFFNSTDNLVIIPNYLLINTSYTISLSLTNFLNQTNVGMATITVDLTNYKPNIKINNLNYAKIYRSSSVYLSTNVNIPSCSNISEDSVSLIYNWRVYQGTRYLPTLKSISNDQRFFKLPGYVLSPMTRYAFVVTISYTNSYIELYSRKLGRNPYSNSLYYYLNVGRSKVIPIIYGGMFRSIYLNPNQSSHYIIDGSSSYDSDYPEDKSILLYSWDCIQLSPLITSYCPFNLTNESYVTLPYDLLSNLTSYCEFNFTLYVASTIDKIYSSIYQIITIIDNHIPNVNINNSQYIEKYNVNDKITLTAFISSNSTSNLTSYHYWQSYDVFDINSVVVSTSSIYINNTNTINNYIFQLAIKPNSLFGNKFYTFTLYSTFTTGSAKAFASVTILTNSPPISGDLNIHPNTGTELSSVFNIQTYGWIDSIDDYPLLYSYYYASTYLQTSFLSIQSSFTYLSAILSRGDETDSYKGYIVIEASDIYNSSSNISTVIFVKPTIIAIDYLSEYSNKYFNLYSNLYDFNSINQLAIVSSNLLLIGYHNCSLTSAYYCLSTLFRYPCSYITNTCNECLPGYVSRYNNNFGLDQCINSSVVLSIGSYCLTNSECISDVCRNKQCVQSNMSKSCPNDCSGHGKCNYYTNYNELVDSCSISNSSCYSNCICSSTYSGIDCSITTKQSNKTGSVKSTLCNHLYLLSNYYDVSTDYIQWLNSVISNVFSYFYDLDSETSQLCIEAYITSISPNSILSINDVLYVNILMSLSKILSITSTVKLPVDLINQVIHILELITKKRQLYLSNYEEDKHVYDSFKINLIKFPINYFTNKVSVIIPNQLIESLNLINDTEVGIFLDSSTVYKSSLLVSSTVIELTKNPRNLINQSSNILVNTDSYSNNGLTTYTDTNISFYVSIQINNYNGVVYYTNETIHQRYQCPYSITKHNHTVNCSNSNYNTYIDNYKSQSNIYRYINTEDYVVTCPGDNYFGYIDVTCPAKSNEPICVTYDSSTNAYNKASNCMVNYFNSYQTECVCKSSTSDSSSYLYNDLTTKLLLTTVPFVNQLVIEGKFEIVGVIYSYVNVYINIFILLICFIGLYISKYIDNRIDGYITLLINYRIKYKTTTRTFNSFFHTLVPVYFQKLSKQLIFTIMLYDKHIYLSIYQCISNFQLFDKYFNSDVDSNVDTYSESKKDNRLSSKINKADKKLTNQIDKIIDRYINNKHDNSISIKWFIVTSRIIHIIILTTVIIYVFNGDVNVCQKLSTKMNCLNKYSYIFVHRQCQWIEIKQSCRYNNYNHYHSYIDIIINSMIILIICSILDKVVDFILFYKVVTQNNNKSYANNLQTIIKKKNLETDLSEDVNAINIPRSNIEDFGDEMIEIQNKKLSIYRCARMMYMSDNIDNISPENELKRLIKQCKKQLWFPPDPNIIAKKYNNNIAKVILDTLNSLRYDFMDIGEYSSINNILKINETSRHNLIINKIKSCRKQCVDITNIISFKSSNQEKDKLLFQYFLIYSLTSYQKKIALHYIIKINKISYSKLSLKTLNIWILWFIQQAIYIYLIMLLIILFYLNVYIGNNNTLLYIVTIIVILIQDIVLIQPMKLYVKFIYIPSFVSNELATLHDILKIKSKSLLLRKSNMMKNLHSLIQHFNPICRVARLFPQLTTARILITLHDYDLPIVNRLHSEIEPELTIQPLNQTPLYRDKLSILISNIRIYRKYHFYWMFRYINNIIYTMLYLFMLLNDDTQTIIIDIIVCLLINGSIILFTLLILYNTALFIGILFVPVFIFILVLSYNRLCVYETIEDKLVKDRELDFKRKREMGKLKAVISPDSLNWLDVMKYDRSNLLNNRMMYILRDKGKSANNLSTNTTTGSTNYLSKYLFNNSKNKIKPIIKPSSILNNPLDYQLDAHNDELSDVYVPKSLIRPINKLKLSKKQLTVNVKASDQLDSLRSDSPDLSDRVSTSFSNKLKDSPVNNELINKSERKVVTYSSDIIDSNKNKSNKLNNDLYLPLRENSLSSIDNNVDNKLDTKLTRNNIHRHTKVNKSKNNSVGIPNQMNNNNQTNDNTPIDIELGYMNTNTYPSISNRMNINEDIDSDNHFPAWH